MNLKHIDSIRGIAVLLILLIHTSQSFSFRSSNNLIALITAYGQMGVQLFFIASSYTLCLSADSRSGESNRKIKFYIRRFFRIAPAYYAGILFYFIASIVINRYKTGYFFIEEKYSVANVWANIFFIHGFYPPANNNIVPGGWSIGTEMAFYLIFPHFFSYINRKKVSTRNILFFLLSSLSISQLFIFFMHHLNYGIANNNFVYHNFFTQLPVFSLGISYYLISKHFNINHTYKTDLLFFIFFTLLSVFLWRCRINYLFSIIPITSGISFIFLTETFRKSPGMNLEYLIKFGQASFSMYLIHFTFAYHLLRLLLYKFPILNHTLFFYFYYLIVIILSYLVSTLSLKYIEEPGKKLGKKLLSIIDKKFSNSSKLAAP